MAKAAVYVEKRSQLPDKGKQSLFSIMAWLFSSVKVSV
jgi:hypothetical protein